MKAYCQRYAVTECHLFHVFISTERYYEDFLNIFSRENAGAHKVIAEENKQKNKFLYATEEEKLLRANFLLLF